MPPTPESDCGTATLQPPSAEVDYGRRTRYIHRAIAAYSVFSLSWIFLSDQLLIDLNDPRVFLWISMLKGGVFVVLSACLLYFVLHAVPQGPPPGLPQSLIEAMSNLPREWPPGAVYFFAVIISVAMLAVCLEINYALDGPPLIILLILPIQLSALLGGLGPGLLATALAIGGLGWFLLGTGTGNNLERLHNLLNLGLLLACGLVVSFLSQTLHRTQSRAEARRKLFDAIIAGSQDAVFVKDRSGRYVLCNEATARFIGLRSHDMLGRDDSQLFPGSTAEMLHRADQSILDSGHARVLEERLETLSGKQFVFFTHKAPIMGRKGEVLGLFGIARDITESTQAASRLRESETRYRELFANMSEGFALGEPIYDEKGEAVDFRLLDVNDAFEHQTGFRRQQVLERPSREYLPQMESEWVARYARVARTGRAERFEIRGPLSGRYYNVYAFCPSPGRFATLFADVTERTVALQEVQRLNSELEERVKERTAELALANQALLYSNMELRHFAHVAAHDLQTPLRSIVGFAQLLERDLGELRPPVSDWLGQIIGNTRRLQGLIRELLEYTRLDKQSRPFVSCDLQKIFEEVMETLAPLIAERQAEIAVDPLPSLNVDRIQIVQLFQHLVENGIKYNHSRPPRVRISCERRQEEWLFAIADNGIGIEPRHQQAIFEPFHRLHTYDEIPGSGIGLAACRRIVESHGGQIWVESRPGEGSTFRFTLPAPDSSPAPIDVG